ncbi:MAG: fibronectin type III domain-containing protein, partial [Candidatus Thermoplasmatota archaeon]|nr:fibronectin type III domain-containing protein [Candidatus Thermoplasmatota archaeon]
NLVGPSESSEPAGNIYPGLPKGPVIGIVKLVAGRIMIKWTPNATDGGAYTRDYNIYRTVPGEQVERIAVVEGHVLIYIDQNVEEGGIYEYYLTAENEAGESVRSEKVMFKFEEESEDYDNGRLDIISYFLAAILILLVLLIMIFVIVGRRGGREEDTFDWGEE